LRCPDPGQPHLGIDQGQIAPVKKLLDIQVSSIGGIEPLSDFTKKGHHHTIRPGRDAISAVKLSQQLTAEVDAWAEAHDTARSDAIRRLVELGLSATSPLDQSAGAARRDPVEIEHLAVKQIDQLLDPSLPIAERERRIRRLTEGPPEFFDERIDLPKPKK
jgi:hypothetical protein